MGTEKLKAVAKSAIAALLLLTCAACGRQEPAAPAVPASPATPATPGNPVDAGVLLELSRAVRSGEFAASLEPLLSDQHRVPQQDAAWPELTYLLGEAHLKREDLQQARAKFRDLASWASTSHPAGPYGDTWGGSGLAVMSLWRWLQILEKSGPATADEVARVLAVATELDATRFYAGMVRSAFLPALPFVEEDIARRLAHVAWKNHRPEAQSLFLNFVAIDSSGAYDATDLEIQREVLKKGLVSPRRLELFRARRLLGLAKTADEKNRAAASLKSLWQQADAPADVRAEAGYEWANDRRLQPDRGELIRVLDSVLALAGEDPVAAKALYRRAATHNRGTAPGDLKAFRADMEELLRRFPRSGLADDALYQLATESLFRVEVDEAEALFARLRDFQGPNDYVDSAYFLAALGHIARAGPSDPATADKLLDTYIRKFPDGVFRLRCLFWRGRIAEQGGRTEPARALFRQVRDEAPYDYYGIRARMHLEGGAAAIGRDLPGPGSATRRELHEAFQASRVDTGLAGMTPYHARLQSAVGSGLYRELLAVNRGVKLRLDDIRLDLLDERGLVPDAALLLSLRQDALAAKDSALTADNWLRLAGLIGVEAEDWPLAVEMTFVPGSAPRARTTELQRDPRYLATLYPSPKSLKLLASLTRAAWPIEGSRALSQSLMYSVVRHESRFFPGAISQVGALGLFQFMPALFSRLERNGNLPEARGGRSTTEYLFDPGRSARLWANWLKAEFPVTNRTAVAIALMKHQAGSPSVERWGDYWKKMGTESDIELRIETARYNVTRNFVRATLGDTAIVDAAGYFED